MAKTIEELDFKIKIDDRDFDKQIRNARKEAANLNIELSRLLELKKSSNNLTQKEYLSLKRLDNLESNRRINADKEAISAERRVRAIDGMTNSQKRYNAELTSQNRILNEARNIALSYISIWGAKKLIQSIVETTGEFELQRTTLAAMLQDASKATQIFEQLQSFSVMSPFSFKELATYAKQLTAYSVPVKELFNTTKMLADVSAGLGVGMDRLVLAYGQVRSAEFLRGQEVRQFTESGIPILEELRKQFEALGEEGITVADVFDKISKRMVPFEMVDKVFKDLTSEGGKFYKMQEVQSETLKGKISNLKDAYMIMFNEIGTRQSSILKGSVDVIRGIAENYEKIGRVLVGLVATYGSYRAILALVKVAEMAVLQAHLGNVSAVKGLGAAIEILTKKSKAYAAIQKLISGINPWVAIGAAVAGIGAYFISAAAQASRFRKELAEIASVKFAEAERMTDTFKRLADQLKNSTEGSQAYRDAIAEINRQYGDYLPNLLNEKNALSEILKIENDVTGAIMARAKAYASEEGIRKIESKYGEDIVDNGTKVESIVANKYGSDAARDFLKGYRERLKASSENWYVVFIRSLQDYFGDGAAKDVINSASYVMNEAVVSAYSEAIQKLAKEEGQFLAQMDVRFGAQGYSTNLERQITEPIVAAYNKALQELRSQKLPAEVFAEKATALEIGELQQLKQAFEQLNTDGAWTNKIKEIQSQIDSLEPKDLGWLQRIVNPLVSGGNTDLKARADTGYDEYLDKLRKEYKAVTEVYADSDATYRKLIADKQKGIVVDEDILRKAAEQNELYNRRKKVIEDIGKALGISLTDSSKKTPSGGKSQAQKDLETRIDFLKKLQSAYERLSEYVGDDKMGDILSNLFSSSEVENKDDIIRSLDYRKQLIAAALEMEKYDKGAAERLRSYIGYDEVSEQVNAYKELAKAQKETQTAGERYRDFMQGWITGTETEGEGAGFKLSKIVSDYSKALDAIAKKSSEAREKLYAKADAERKVGGWSAIGFSQDFLDIRNREQTATANAANEFAEKGREAIKKLYEEWRNGTMDFNNLSDKTLGQLRNMKSQIDGFSADNKDIFPPETLENLKTLGIGLEEIQKILAKLKGEDIGKLDPDIKKESINRWQDITSEISNAAGAVKEYADAAGNDALSAAMGGLMDMADIASGVLSKLAEGDVLGAVISGISTLFQKIMDAFTASARLTAAIADAADEAERLNAEARLAQGVDTFWGDNVVAKIRNATNVMKDYASAVAKIGYDFPNRNINWRSGLFGWGSSSKNIQQALAEMGYELYDLEGRINTQGLQKILDTYEDLFSADRKWIEDAIKNADIYNEAVKALNDTIADTWGGIADNMADKLITARKEVGDAYHALAGDLRQTFGDMADSIARDLVSSFIVDNILNKYNDDLKELYGMIASGRNNDDIANAFVTMAKSIEADAGIAAQFTNELYDAFESAGLDFSSSSEKLSEGIKGITEDTANLLASYLNAVRADVATGNMQRSEILSVLRGITVMPNIDDYLNRIQANTYDTAQNTRDLLLDIRSMMTTETGQVALRVLS